MANTVRTVRVPLKPGPALPFFSPKDPRDILEYGIDAAAWLADADLVLLECLPEVDPSLLLLGCRLDGDGNAPTRVLVTLAGGINGTVPVVTFPLELDNGNRLMFAVRLPIQARAPAGLVPFDPAPPDGVLAIDGKWLLLNGLPLVSPPTDEGTL